LDIILAVILFLLGICVGSFLNVVADRVPQGKSIISPPSYCFNCGHTLESRDLIPVISYLWLRGKCRYCHSSITARSMLVELFTGLLFVLAFLTLGFGWKLAGSLISISIFVVLAVTDIESGIIPHKIVYPAIGIVALIAIANTFLVVQPDIWSALLGFGLAVGVFLLLWGVPRLFKKNIMGFGVVGMAALIGVSTGFPLAGIALSMVVLIGGLTLLVLVSFRSKKASGPIHFGLYLALGAIGTILWGRELLAIASFLVSHS
jgi:leader peptidase (prepilin peptidase) / N-methyltransferase